MNLLIIFCPLPAGHRGGTTLRLGRSARQFQAPARIDTISRPGGLEEVCSQSAPLGGTESSNLLSSSGESATNCTGGRLRSRVDEAASAAEVPDLRPGALGRSQMCFAVRHCGRE